MRIPKFKKSSEMAQPFKRANAFWLTAAIVVAVSLLLLWRRRSR